MSSQPAPWVRPTSKNNLREEELPLVWFGPRKFLYATERRDAEIAASARHENHPLAADARTRPFLWQHRSVFAGHGRNQARPYYETEPNPVANQLQPVRKAPKLRNRDQQADWETYQKYRYTQQVRHLGRDKQRPYRLVAPKRCEYCGYQCGLNSHPVDQEECTSQRTVFCQTCGDEIQERFFKSHGLTCWPLMIEYPQDADVPLIEQGPGYSIGQGTAVGATSWEGAPRGFASTYGDPYGQVGPFGQSQAPLYCSS